AVWNEHDGVLDSRVVRPRVQQRHRDLWTDGFVVGIRDPAEPVFHRDARLGVGEKVWLHDAGPDVSRPLGVRTHRHRDLRGAGELPRALYRDRRAGRWDDTVGDQRWA